MLNSKNFESLFMAVLVPGDKSTAERLRAFLGCRGIPASFSPSPGHVILSPVDTARLARDIKVMSCLFLHLRFFRVLT